MTLLCRWKCTATSATGIVAVAVLLCSASLCLAADRATESAQVKAILEKEYPQLEKVYLQLHQYPEIAFQEVNTSALLAAQMRALGFEVTEKVGRTGIVAIYKNGEGPTVMVRTELDALPLEEKTGLPYASHVETTYEGKRTFVAQSCGHDAHMAWWLGAAHALVAMKDQWHGTLMFVGQPAEETVSGAAAMIQDGLFTRFPKPDFGFAAHVGSRPAGKIYIKDGTHSSAVDNLRITFVGRGGHGARPNTTIDPIVMGAHFVSDVQTVISREKDPGAFGVVTVGSFQSGSVGNIIPNNATLELTLRSFTPDIRKLLLEGVERTAKSEAMMAKAPEPIIDHLSGTAALINPSGLVAKAASVMNESFGKETVTVIPSTVPGGATSEDYSEYVLAGVPSVYFNIGGGDPAKLAEYAAKGVPVPTNHSPEFSVLPKPAILTGARVLTMAVLMVTDSEAAKTHAKQ